MFAYFKLPRPWMKWALFATAMLAVVTYGFCHFIANYDPDFPWSGDLGRSLKSKGVRAYKLRNQDKPGYAVVIQANQQSPPASLASNEIEAIAALGRIEMLDIHGASGPWVAELLNAVRELESTKSIRLHQVALTDQAVDVLNKFDSLATLSLTSQPDPGRVLARLQNRSIIDLSLDHSYFDDETLVGLSADLRLETLSLSGSQGLNSEHFDKVAAIKTLKKLRLNHAGIDGDGLAQLKDHPALEDLSLNHAHLSGRDLREISSNKALKTLFLDGPFPANSYLKAVGTMEYLETLILMNSLGTEKGLAHLKGAKNLKALQVNLHITEVGIRHLAALPNLEELKVHLRITRPVIRELAALKKLRTLDPSERFPPIETELRKELDAALPNLVVQSAPWRQPQ